MLFANKSNNGLAIHHIVNQEGAGGDPKLAAIAMVEATTDKRGERSVDRRYYIASAALPAPRFAAVIRGHWTIENSLHRVLDVVFKNDLSRLRAGHGARSMTDVRHFAIDLVRAANDRKSIKSRRKVATCGIPTISTASSMPHRINPDSLPCMARAGDGRRPRPALGSGLSGGRLASQGEETDHDAS